ncbi:hypothetical protein JYT93_00985 [bacterium AH-315-J19]|nr:hypothetical protein [Robiginitomaculum sp.]MBN4058589.1 hypothetical protein [bacterium AH-315-J19]
MDTFIKWLLNVTLLLAFMFLGLKAQPKPDDAEDKKPKKPAILRILS